MTFIVMAFLIIALRSVVFALVELARARTILMTMAKGLQLVAMLTSIPVTVVVTSDVLSIIKAVASIRVLDRVNITTIVGLRVIVTIRVLAAVVVATAASIVVVSIVSVLSGEQVNYTIAIEEVINGLTVITFTIKSSRSNITGGLAG